MQITREEAALLAGAAALIALVSFWAARILARIAANKKLVVTGLFIYPVKSCRGIQVPELTFDNVGIVNDRRFIIIDELGSMVTIVRIPPQVCACVLWQPNFGFSTVSCFDISCSRSQRQKRRMLLINTAISADGQSLLLSSLDPKCAKYVGGVC